MKPKRKPSFVVQDAGHDTILYSSSKKVIHVLNPTAKLIWNLCDGNHTIEDMEQTLRTNFSIADKHDVSGDIRKILEVFSSKGILEIHNYGAAC